MQVDTMKNIITERIWQMVLQERNVSLFLKNVKVTPEKLAGIFNSIKAEIVGDGGNHVENSLIKIHKRA